MCFCGKQLFWFPLLLLGICPFACAHLGLQPLRSSFASLWPKFLAFVVLLCASACFCVLLCASVLLLCGPIWAPMALMGRQRWLKRKCKPAHPHFGEKKRKKIPKKVFFLSKSYFGSSLCPQITREEFFYSVLTWCHLGCLHVACFHPLWLCVASVASVLLLFASALL